MNWIAAESGVAYGDSEAATKAHRILADHGRGMTFLVGDGVTPSNEGRGYVLRRIIRRAVQQARTIGLSDLWRITDVVVEQMGQSYPELAENRQLISETVKAEEERFSQTLERGLKLFEEIAAQGAISGDDAFTLAATYGFPIELTRELARRARAGGRRGRVLAADGRAPRVSRAGGGGAAGRRTRRASQTTSSATRRLDVLTAIARATSRSTTACSRRSSASRRSTRKAAARSPTRATSSTTRRARARCSAQADRLGDDQVADLRGRGLRRGRPRSRRRRLAGSLPDDGQPHRDASPAQGAPGRPRRPRRQAGSAVRPDKLRFDFTHAQRAHLGGAQARSSAVVNEKVFENLAVRDVRDADRGGAEARRDDALRREVRRRGARRRDPRLLAGALRRDARALDRGDRAVRDHLRELGRLGRRAASRRSPPARRTRTCTARSSRRRSSARRPRSSASRARSRRRPRPPPTSRCWTSPTASSPRRSRR